MREKLKELRLKSTVELKSLLAKKRKELLKARLDLKMKKAKNVHQAKSIRKEIAKILTILREKELVEARKGETL